MTGRLKYFFTRTDAPVRRILDAISSNRWAGAGSVILFFLALNWFYGYIGIYERLDERPCSIHSSSQCQRASIAQNYYHIDMNFFKPRVNRFDYSGGITGSEFPIIYYLAAISYKLFGFNDMYLKLINLLFVTLGFYFFFRLAQQFLKNAVLSVFLVCAAVVSPVLLYYSANMLPDAPALGLVLCAWFFFFRYLKSNKNKHLYFFVAFGTLAGLIKVISVMCFFVAFGLIFLDWLGFFKNEEGKRKELIQKKGRVILSSIIGMLIIVAWYYYCRLIYHFYGNPPSLMNTMIVTDSDTLAMVWGFMKNWIFDYYPSEAYVLMACGVVFILVNIRRVNRLLLSLTVIYILGSACYLYLFLYQFMHHDYYIVAMLPSVFFLFLTFFDLVSRISLRYTVLINALFIIILVFNLKESLDKSRKIYATRFDAKVYFSADYRPYYDLRPRLRDRGIKWEDKFVIAFDESYSNSLYFIDQAGYTIEKTYEPELIDKILKKPDAKYLILSDSAMFNKMYPNNFADKIIMYHRGLIIYKLK